MSWEGLENGHWGHGDWGRCSRLSHWLSSQDSRPQRTSQGRRAFIGDESTPQSASDVHNDRVRASEPVRHDEPVRHGEPVRASEPEWYGELVQVLSRLEHASRPLFWLESADVATTRAVVRVANLVQGTVHVAAASGSRGVKARTQTDGWIGTTLSEVAQHVGFVLHLGREHLKEMPLLHQRFLTRRNSANQLEQWGLSEDERDELGLACDWNLPKVKWFELFTKVLLILRQRLSTLKPFGSSTAVAVDESDIDEKNEPPIDLNHYAQRIAQKLMNSPMSVVVWGEGCLEASSDSVILGRLLEIARLVSDVNRCSLLPLPSDLGKQTAADTLLWLTNQTCSTLRATSDGWVAANHTEQFRLEDWRSEYDYLACIRSLPSDRALPSLEFNLILDTQTDMALKNCEREQVRLDVAAVGVDCSGHLIRSDHGFCGYVPELQQIDRKRPTAVEVLSYLARQLEMRRGRST